ncbi:hypothetical protein GCM10027294_33770 [Marinactinospora endophytica]
MQHFLDTVESRLNLPSKGLVDTRQSEETARDSTAHLKAPHVSRARDIPLTGIPRALGMNKTV